MDRQVANDILRAVAAAHGQKAERSVASHWAVERVAGGANNALYRVTGDGQQIACKLCVPDNRQRAAREYRVMELLRSAGADVAPVPLWLDESCTLTPFPAVMYRWLPGDPLPTEMTRAQWAAFAGTIQQIHALRQANYGDSGLPDAWFHWFDVGAYLAELEGMLRQFGSWLSTTSPHGAGLQARLARIIATCSGCLRASGVDLARDRVPLSLCRVDANRLNVIWGLDARLRWVDWEYSGWGDPALDLADLRWHAALENVSDEQHGWLRAAYQRPPGDASFDARLDAFDRLLVSRWPLLVLRVLWSQANGTDRLRLSQMPEDQSGALGTFYPLYRAGRVASGIDVMRLLRGVSCLLVTAQSGEWNSPSEAEKAGRCLECTVPQCLRALLSFSQGISNPWHEVS